MKQPENSQNLHSQSQSSVEQADTLSTGTKMSEELSNIGSRSFGANLKWAREQKNCTLDEAADHLYILKRHLQALEAEDFEALPQMTFARGFAINYAKYLGLDPNVIVKSFDEVYPEHLKSSGNIKAPLKPLGTLQRDSRRPSFRINPFLILGIIALIALAVFLLRTVNNARQETAPNQQDETAISDISSSEQAQGAALTDSTGDQVTTVEGSGLEIGSAGSAINNTDNTAASDQTDATLDFWVRNNTDITVTDAKGVVLMSGNQPRGGYQIIGQPPFQIQINKVNNVTLNLNQEKVPLADYAQNDQANFALEP